MKTVFYSGIYINAYNAYMDTQEKIKLTLSELKETETALNYFEQLLQNCSRCVSRNQYVIQNKKQRIAELNNLLNSYYKECETFLHYYRNNLESFILAGVTL